jgi:hypothetical protein
VRSDQGMKPPCWTHSSLYNFIHSGLASLDT